MRLPGSAAASESLGAYARGRLAESAFFADLSVCGKHWRTTQRRIPSLTEAARMEIWEHVTFWDDSISQFLPRGVSSRPE